MSKAMMGLVAGCLLAGAAGGAMGEPVEAPPPPSRTSLPSLTNDEAWSRLPRETPPLPAWARILAEPLPRTTAAMLHLDYVHRAKNPLDPVLRAKLRWVAADANRCTYGRRYAEADLAAAGRADPGADVRPLIDAADLPAPEAAALAFARKLTLAAHEVTDDEVAELLEHFGPEQAVAIVHTLAHANFQDRIFLALGVAVEPGGPFPPLDASTDADGTSRIRAPARPAWNELDAAEAYAAGASPAWAERGLADLRSSLERQKQRAPRIPFPGPPPGSAASSGGERPEERIVWTRISMGYQPGLTRAWFECMRTFQQEATLDRVFANSLFWVITRSNECFY